MLRFVFFEPARSARIIRQSAAVREDVARHGYGVAAVQFEQLVALTEAIACGGRAAGLWSGRFGFAARRNAGAGGYLVSRAWRRSSTKRTRADDFVEAQALFLA
jgi:hypothetical protein